MTTERKRQMAEPHAVDSKVSPAYTNGLIAVAGAASSDCCIHAIRRNDTVKISDQISQQLCRLLTTIAYQDAGWAGGQLAVLRMPPGCISQALSTCIAKESMFVPKMESTSCLQVTQMLPQHLGKMLADTRRHF